jgi:hypothetical protein
MNGPKDNKHQINFGKYTNIPLKVEKIEDTKFDNNHPNGYNPGFVIDGCEINLIVSNQHCCLFVTYGGRWFHTSEVQKQEEFEGYDLLHTLNSVYKVTPIFTAIPGVQEKYSLTLEKDGGE